MLPSIEEAIKELEIAEKMNPGPWVKHSMNVGIAAYTPFTPFKVKYPMR